MAQYSEAKRSATIITGSLSVAWLIYAHPNEADRNLAHQILARQSTMTESQIATTRPQFIASVETLAVYQLLAPTEIGATVPYAAITKTLGKDYRRMPCPIHTARKRLLREKGMVFAAIFRQGLKRLNDAEIVESSQDTVDRIRNASRRKIGVLSVVDRNALPREGQIMLDTHMTLLGVMATVTKPDRVKQLATRIAENNAVMAARSALLALAGNGDKS